MLPYSSLLILTAMEVERAPVIAAFSGGELEFPNLGCPMRLNDRAHLLSCGIGPVNTAFRLGQALHHTCPDAILMLGVGGGLKDSVQVGDLVIGSQVIQHDNVYRNGDRVQLMPPGKMYLSVETEKREQPQIDCDKQMQQWLKSAADQAGFTTHHGVVASGSAFLACNEHKQRVHEACSNALLVDMESGAAAQIARDAGIPFLVAKFVSDALDAQSGNTDEEYFKSLPFLSKQIETLVRNAFGLQEAKPIRRRQ